MQHFLKILAFVASSFEEICDLEGKAEEDFYAFLNRLWSLVEVFLRYADSIFCGSTLTNTLQWHPS